jgi:hypothetical protein
MGIVRLRRVHLKIPSIGEHTYTTLLRTVQCADFSFILAHDNIASTITQCI